VESVTFDIHAAIANPGSVAWQPFRPGIEIHRLYGDGEVGASAALLRYAPGAEVPSHLHRGAEHILVLQGSQEDERGCYGPGTFVVNSPGSTHRVFSRNGCLVLVVWERPVQFLAGRTSSE